MPPSRPDRLLPGALAALLACASAGRAPPGARPAPPAAPTAGSGTARAALDEARAHMREQAWADAERSYARAAELDPSLAEPRRARGRLLAVARRFEDAAAELRRALALDAADAGTWGTLAAVEVSRGDDTAAQDAFEAAARAAGKAAAVDAVWTELVAIPPDPAQPQESIERCARGRVALMEGLVEDAVRETLNGLRYAPRFAWCRAAQAEAIWRLGHASAAEAVFRRALADFAPGLEGLRADASARLAALLVATRRSGPEAATLVQRAIALRGERPPLLALRAEACRLGPDAVCRTPSPGAPATGHP